VRTIKFEPLDAAGDLAVVRSLPFVTRIERSSDGYEVSLEVHTDPADAIRAITAVVPVAAIQLARPRLEDIFVRIVAADDPDTPPDGLKAALQGHAEGVSL
jgi:hypothetical protein